MKSQLENAALGLQCTAVGRRETYQWQPRAEILTDRNFFTAFHEEFQ
jgi:hypothetical protein